ncbi:MAG: hypothetical protein P4L51_20580, partial [Puia sp.]|nr:hypothetical protein [Puia sp.]
MTWTMTALVISILAFPGHCDQPIQRAQPGIRVDLLEPTDSAPGCGESISLSKSFGSTATKFVFATSSKNPDERVIRVNGELHHLKLTYLRSPRRMLKTGDKLKRVYSDGIVKVTNRIRVDSDYGEGINFSGNMIVSIHGLTR